MPRVGQRPAGAGGGSGADGAAGVAGADGGAVQSLYKDQSDHATVGTSEETLDSFVLPADTLAVDGETLRMRIYLQTAANGNNKTVAIKFGGTTVGAFTGVSNNNTLTFEIDIVRVGATAQLGFVSGQFSPDNGAIGQAHSVPAETLSGPVTIAVDGTTASQAGDLTLKSWSIEKIAAGGSSVAAITVDAGMLTLHEDHVDHATVGTSEETLDSFSVPADTLGVDGEYLRIFGRAVTADNANDKTITIRYGGTIVATIVRSPIEDESWEFEAIIRRTGAATQVSHGVVRGGPTNFGGGSFHRYEDTAPTEALSGAVLIAIDATTPSSSGDMTLKSWGVEKIAAPGGTISQAPAVVPAVTALYEDHADHATTGTIKETLDSFVLPADTLAVDGEGLRITAVFQGAANGNSKVVGIDFGGTLVAQINGTGSSVPFAVVVELWRVGAGAQRTMGVAHRDGAAGDVIYETPSEDETGTITIAAHGTTSAASGDVTLRSWRIEKIAAPA